MGAANVILVSIHVNAFGNGTDWTSLRGWSVYTSKGRTRADLLATYLYEAARKYLPGHQLRHDFTDGDPDIEENFYIIRHTICPAVLTENLFMTSKEDVAFLQSDGILVKEFCSAVLDFQDYEKVLDTIEEAGTLVYCITYNEAFKPGKATQPIKKNGNLTVITYKFPQYDEYRRTECLSDENGRIIEEKQFSNPTDEEP